MHKVMGKRELMVKDVHCNIVVNILEHTINYILNNIGIITGNVASMHQ